MGRTRWTLITLTTLATVVGCRKGESPPATTAPATGADVAPALAPASTLVIDGRPTAFPPSRLKVTGGDGSVAVLLYTDEAATAGDDTANTVLLAMSLDVNAPTDLPTATCHLARQTDDAEADTPNGLFLNGGAVQLVPDDANVTFAATGELVTLAIDGTFTQLGAGEKARAVKVKGTLAAVVDVAGR